MKRSSAYFVAFVAAILLASPGMAKEEIGSTAGTPFLPGLAKSLAADGPVATVMNINNFGMWVRRDGYFPYGIAPNGCVGNYPIGTANIIYGEGMLWGAKVSDGGATRVRVNGSTYAVGLKAGRVLYDTDGKAVGSEDKGTRHAWRVRRDYKTANLKVDASHYFQVLLTSVTEDEVQEVYDQYDYDWNNWPAVEGAPFEDVDDDGVYDPAVDIPGWPGATQTIWLVTNDLPEYWDADENLVPDPTEGGAPAVTDTTNVSTISYGAPPIGIEMQLTLWGYDFAPTHPLGNVLFKRARIIYTGLPGGPSDASMDTCYFTQWSDPDLGTYTDDYVGCDTSLSLGYVYNGNAIDGTFMGDYGLAVPAGGYDFLQGPIVDGDTLGMTSFTYFGAGSAISDPTLGEYEGTNQFFNLMEGFLPRPGYPVQQDWNNPLTGVATKFTLSGDPVSGTGWIDGIQLPPGDRRLVMTTGPFVMSLGDTQDVVLATVAGMGQDNISSVTVLKYHDTFAQYAYDNDFNLPSPPPAPLVEVTGLDGQILLDWGEDLVAVANTEEAAKMGFVFEGYNVYQLPTATSAMSDAVKVATYDVINLVQAIFDPGVDPASGFILEQLKQSGTNSGVQRYFSTTEDGIRGQPISNGIPYFFAVTAYSYLADFEGSPFKTLESSPNVLAVIADQEVAGTDLSQDHSDLITTSHDAGTSTALVEVRVIDPTKLVDATWGLYFSYYDIATGAHLDSVTAADTLGDGSPSYDWGWNLAKGGTDVMLNQTHPDKTYAEGANTSDAPIIDGTQIVAYNPPETAVSDWDYSGTRWISGTDLGGPGLFGGLDLGANIFGSDVTGADYVPVELVFQDQADVDANGYVAKGAVYHRHDGYAYADVGEMPFTAWEIDSDGEHVRQLNVSFVESETEDIGSPPANLIWDMGWDGTAFADDGGREYLFIHATTYQEDGLYYGSPELDGTYNDVIYFIWPAARGTHPNLEAVFDLQIYPAIAALAADTFSWTTTAADLDVAITQEDVDMINVFPNPYYGFHPLETSRMAKWVKFNHLPQVADIRIFNLGGTMVRVIHKDDATQYAQWNLQNQSGYPVASGIYIIYIDLPDLGKHKILKLAIIQEEQILTRY